MLELAGLITHPLKSGKLKKTGSWNKSEINPNGLCDRLELLIVSHNAGNNSKSVAKGAIGIIDNTLNNQIITKNEYRALHQRIV